MHNDDKDVASDADRTRTSDPWDTRAPPTKGQEVPPADMDFAKRSQQKDNEVPNPDFRSPG